MRTLVTLGITLALIAGLTVWWLRPPEPSDVPRSGADDATAAATGPAAAPPPAAATMVVQRDLAAAAAPAPEGPVALAPAAAAATVVLTVVAKDDGQPLPGVRVRDLNVEGDAGVSVATDAAGRVEFTRPAGATLVLRGYPVDDGRDAQDLLIRDVAAGERREVTWPIARGPDLEFHGIVLARGGAGASLLATGAERPIAGALVILHEEQGTGPDARTDVAGRFVVLARSWRRPFLDVFAPGFGPAACPVQAGRARAESAERILLSAGATLRGRVVDPRGVPAKAFVSLSVQRTQIAQPVGEWPSFSTLMFRGGTGAEGRFELTNLPGGVELNLSITTETPGIAPIELPRALRLEPGETVEREFRLASLARIVGIVVDQDGAAVGTARLAAVPRGEGQPTLMTPALLKDPRHRYATSDANGEFAFDDIPTGPWWIGVDTRDFAPRDGGGRPPASPNLVTVEIPELATEVPVRLVVWRGLFLRGRVVDDGGLPVADAAVWARIAGEAVAEGTNALEAESDAEGRFEIGPLPPVTFELRADGRDVGRGLTRSEVAAATPGGETVTLTIPRTGAVLVARVVDRATGLGVDAWVSAALAGQTLFANRSESDGRVRLDVTQAGTWSLRATTRDGRIALAPAVDVAAGSESKEVSLELVPGATLVLHAPPAGPGAPVDAVATFTIWLGETLVADDACSPERPARATVPPGTLRVQFLTEDALPIERIVAVDAGATAEVRAD